LASALGAFLSTKGAFLSLTKDRKGAFLSTKSATLRMEIDKVLLDVIYEHTIHTTWRGGEQRPGGDECDVW
jgi:hypothetical protein